MSVPNGLPVCNLFTHGTTLTLRKHYQSNCSEDQNPKIKGWGILALSKAKHTQKNQTLCEKGERYILNYSSGN